MTSHRNTPARTRQARRPSGDASERIDPVRLQSIPCPPGKATGRVLGAQHKHLKALVDEVCAADSAYEQYAEFLRLRSGDPSITWKTPNQTGNGCFLISVSVYADAWREQSTTHKNAIRHLQQRLAVAFRGALNARIQSISADDDDSAASTSAPRPAPKRVVDHDGFATVSSARSTPKRPAPKAREQKHPAPKAREQKRPTPQRSGGGAASANPFAALAERPAPQPRPAPRPHSAPQAKATLPPWMAPPKPKGQELPATAPRELDTANPWARADQATGLKSEASVESTTTPVLAPAPAASTSGMVTLSRDADGELLVDGEASHPAAHPITRASQPTEAEMRAELAHFLGRPADEDDQDDQDDDTWEAWGDDDADDQYDDEPAHADAAFNEPAANPWVLLATS